MPGTPAAAVEAGVIGLYVMFSAHHLDLSIDCPEPSERPVPRQQLGAESLRQGQVERVVDRGIVAQRERPRQQRGMRMPLHLSSPRSSRAARAVAEGRMPRRTARRRA